MRYLITFSYDGTNFSGYQKQPNKRTVQEEIESVLSRSYLDVNTYKRIINNPNIRALIPEEQVIDFGENDELASRYFHENLTLSDIHENADVFRGKKFLSKISGFRYSQERFEDIAEEKIFYLFYALLGLLRIE